MNIKGKHWQTIWYNDKEKNISVIDQTLLPHQFKIKNISSSKEAYEAIKNMVVRGAPLIGVTGAYGLVLACLLYTSPSPRDRTRSRMPSSA